MSFIFMKQVIFFRSYTDRNKTRELQKQQPIGHQPPLFKAHNNVACKYNSHTILILHSHVVVTMATDIAEQCR